LYDSRENPVADDRRERCPRDPDDGAATLDWPVDYASFMT